MTAKSEEASGYQPLAPLKIGLGGPSFRPLWRRRSQRANCFSRKGVRHDRSKSRFFSGDAGRL